MNKVAVYLSRQISGNVFDREKILEHYSKDQSILIMKPKFIAFPESTKDVENLLRFADQLALKNYKLPVGIWGSGLDTTGADLTNGLLISTERLNKIKEIDVHDRLIHIQSGVTLGQLNTTLQTHGLFLPIDANQKETIGALIANCPTDSYASRYGGIMNYIERIEVVLSDGTCIQTTPLKRNTLTKKQSQNNLEGKIYRNLPKLILENKSLINHLSETQDLSGYPMISQCESPDKKAFDLLPIFYASQGTLGVITEIILRAEVIPPQENHIISTTSSFTEAYEILMRAKPLSPTKLYFYDLAIINPAIESGRSLSSFTKKIPNQGYLIHLSYEKNHQNAIKFNNFFESLPKNHRIFIDEKDIEPNKEIQNTFLAYLNPTSKNEYSPLIHNIYVPNSELKNFVHNLSFLEKKYKTDLPLYGSFATNIYSLRPEIKLSTEEDQKTTYNLLNDFNALLKIHHGSFAGGTPEGRLKAPFITLSDDEKGLIKNIKNLFDPQKILSSEIKTQTNPKSLQKYFRQDSLDFVAK